ncbi:siderophore-interacting protein [Hoyosella altamirensis]|uniref:NADPH-dependent ferric siderophore reductase n=1 Tax=Hoyosella altamirensis TaxID=616997 RepID=A0A839RKN1_9ACTN|nr:SIP domain-containing protein [Hoyosella altamirensis]MBB3036947.1 NADPH-dependent ferric siderophore reductase [Hoyosella altamirensis]
MAKRNNLKTIALVETEHSDDARNPPAMHDLHLTWLARETDDLSILDTLAHVSLPNDPCYAFIAGGQKLVSSIRRHLVNERGLPKDAVTFTGYWR